MTIGIVACQFTVTNPYYPVGAKCRFKPFLYLLLRHWLVTVRSHQTAGCRKDSSPPVALNRATLQNEVKLTDVFTIKQSLVEDVAIDGIILRSRKLLTPAVELEIKQTGITPIVDKRDKAVVACPGIVCRTMYVDSGIQSISWTNGKHRLIPFNGSHHLSIGL